MPISLIPNLSTMVVSAPKHFLKLFLIFITIIVAFLSSMKKQILAILIPVLSAYFAFARQLKPNVITKAQSESFVSELQPHLQDDKTGVIMVVYNSKSHYHNKIPRNRNPDITIERGDNGGMLKAFTAVFSDVRLKQLLHEKFCH